MQIRRLQGQTEKQKGIYYEYDADSPPLGEGGMGVVYRGFCVDEKSGVRTEVAIKALHDNLPEEVYARAEREASIQFRHDNLVEMLGLISVFEKNRWGEVIYHHYVISEFLHGMELSDLLVGHFDNVTDQDNDFARNLYRNYVKDKENTSIYIIKNILSGVLALHDKGYIHRDIDPSNIMVTNNGCIKLIDFGIAKNLNALGSKDKLMTAAGKFIGKAEYASPELVLGDVKSQNYTTDIYALGILFYRLLVGELPFTGSQYEVLQEQLKRKVPVKNIENKALAKIIRKATEKKQTNRYHSITEFRVAIDMAEKCPSKNNLWKYAVAIVLVVGVGCGTWFYFAHNAESTNAILSEPTLSERYKKALSLLDSNMENSVKLGFKQMQELANENYDSARVEVGITYFSGTKSDILLQRRKHLNLSNDIDKFELNKVIEYLSKIQDTSVLTPEMYYILGAAYYTVDAENNILKALNSFERALRLLEQKVNSRHGYDNEELQKVLTENIELLKSIKYE